MTGMSSLMGNTRWHCPHLRPVPFFTNVTDSYRLSRAGRLRTDLGGLYFNAVFMLALAGIYTATSSEVLLLVIAFTHLEMLEQLMPFVRFDGYFILSDWVEIPNLAQQSQRQTLC